MKKFSFRLESFLKYRSYLERRAQQEVAKAYRDVKESEMLIQGLKNELLRVAKILDRETVKGISALNFKNYNDYLDGLNGDMVRETRKKTVYEKLLQEKQAVLTRKSVETKVIDRLKIKKKRVYIESFLREEQKQSDEIASLKKAREITNAVH